MKKYLLALAGIKSHTAKNKFKKESLERYERMRHDPECPYSRQRNEYINELRQQVVEFEKRIGI